MSTLDETDVKIIEMLEEDGRKSFTEMAEELKVSESAVRKRVTALVSTGVARAHKVYNQTRSRQNRFWNRFDSRNRR